LFLIWKGPFFAEADHIAFCSSYRTQLSFRFNPALKTKPHDNDLVFKQLLKNKEG